MSGIPSFFRWLGEKTAAGPYRDRVETFAVSPDGQIYGGVWDEDESFAVPGGGIDPGEDPLTGALREFQEETGLQATNARLSGIAPVVNRWSKKHRATLPPDRRHFLGSRTYTVLADLANDQRRPGALDQWKASRRKLYAPEEAISLMTGKKFLAPEVAAARLAVLRQLLNQIRQAQG